MQVFLGAPIGAQRRRTCSRRWDFEDRTAATPRSAIWGSRASHEIAGGVSKGASGIRGHAWRRGQVTVPQHRVSAAGEESSRTESRALNSRKSKGAAGISSVVSQQTGAEKAV